jgi:hypothetical protein
MQLKKINISIRNSFEAVYTSYSILLLYLYIANTCLTIPGIEICSCTLNLIYFKLTSVYILSITHLESYNDILLTKKFQST